MCRELDIPSDRFIPLAQETGLIVPLVRWTIDSAVRVAALLRGMASPQLLGRAFEYEMAQRLSIHP